MKIAFVANSCWNIYNFRRGLVRKFLNRADEVLVLAPRDEYTASIESWGIRFIETPIEGTSTHPLKDIRYTIQLFSIFRKEQPAVALCFTIKSNIYGSLAGLLSGIKTICNVSGLGTVFLVKGISGAVAITLYRLAFRFSNFIFFQNENDRELFTSKVRVNETRLAVLPGSGINLTEFVPLPMPRRKEVKFLMISRLIVEKGVRDFAEAAALCDLPQAHFTLMGRLDESHARSISKEELDQWMENGLNYLPHSEAIKEVIADHDVVVLPSFREGTSRTLLEAAALGRPLLASDVPGCREVIRDGKNGFLFEVKNAKSIESKCRLFLSLSEQERAELARNSRKLVEEAFDENIVINKYVEVIDGFDTTT